MLHFVALTGLDRTPSVNMAVLSLPLEGEMGSQMPQLFWDRISYIPHTLFVFYFCFFETGFLCVALEPCPGTHFVDQAGLKLTEIDLRLPPECWD